MNNYTLLSFHTLSVQGDKCVGNAVILANTEADIPKPPLENWAPGSTALIVKPPGAMVLDNDREWQPWK